MNKTFKRHNLLKMNSAGDNMLADSVLSTTGTGLGNKMEVETEVSIILSFVWCQCKFFFSVL